MSAAELLLAPAAREHVHAFFEPRAQAVDTGHAGVQEGIDFLHRRHFGVWEGSKKLTPSGQCSSTRALRVRCHSS